MESVGIRELRQQASKLIRRVEVGETIEITDRGRPVAVLAPVPEVSSLERMRKGGDVTSASRRISELPEPLSPEIGMPLPSEVLRRLRESDR